MLKWLYMLFAPKLPDSFTNPGLKGEPKIYEADIRVQLFNYQPMHFTIEVEANSYEEAEQKIDKRLSMEISTFVKDIRPIKDMVYNLDH